MTDTKKRKVLLSTTYLGPVQYYSKLIHYNHIIIENHESYSKQSYRNRCTILGANGPLALTIPVHKTSGNNTQVSDIKPDYSQNWQRLHWKSIVSAYNSSPFFEYYVEDFHPFFHSTKWEYLIDFNTELLEMITELLEADAKVEYTKGFQKDPGTEFDDYRYIIHPKKQKSGPDQHFKIVEYTQVFHEKMEFYPNLGIIDLLFNEGPHAISVLEESYI